MKKLISMHLFKMLHCKLRIIFLYIFCILYFSKLSHAQTECGHDFFTNYCLSHDLNFINVLKSQNAFIENYILNNVGQNGYLNAPQQPMLTQPINQLSHVIPVLVHIIPETNNPANDPVITYAQVESQIDALNAYFNGVGVNNNNTQIQFCLVKNNFGAAVNWNIMEPGVLRYSPNPAIANNTLSVAGANALAAFTNLNTPNDFQHILNIWVVKSIDGNCSGVRAYSPLPLSPQANLFPGIILDGIVIAAGVFGSNTIPAGGSFPLVPNYTPCPNDLIVRNQGKILAHEVAHYLSLWHTFQNNLVNNTPCAGAGVNCSADGDFCCDTPPTDVPLSTYINGNPIPATCANIADDVANFMYYADDITLDHFTQNQVNYMLAYLFNFRTDLINVNNLANWGLIGTPSSCITDQVFADFTITGNLCINTAINFAPSIAAPANLATNWQWTFGDGGTANIANPVHTYLNVGLYTVTCTADDGVSTVTSTQTIAIVACNLNPNYVHNDQWHFGNFVSYDFTGGGVIPLVNVAPRNNNTILASETATSYCDNAGNVLFYTNGVNFWNANHVQINNAPVFTSCSFGVDPLTNVTHNTSSQVQGLIACPHPDPNLPNHYFIFASPNGECNLITNTVRYVVLDMNTNTFSPVTTININGAAMSEGINLIPHCNGKDYWLVFGGTNTILYSFLVSEYGVSQNPVNTLTVPFGSYHRIKASPNNNGVVFLHYQNSQYAIEVCQFDNSTGAYSNPSILYSSVHPINAFSFNSNADRIFFHEDDVNSYLKYIDLNNAAINNVNVGNGMAPFLNAYIMQLGPDNHIYGHFTNTFNFRVINANAVPTYQTNTLQVNVIPGIINSYSLPNVMDGVPPPFTPFSISVSYNTCDEVLLTVPPCWDGYDYDINWGDGNTQQSLNPPNNLSHSYATNGTYTITATLLPPGTNVIPLNPIQVTQVVNILNNSTPISGNGSPCLVTNTPELYTVPQLLNASYTWNISANGVILNGQGTYQVNVDWMVAGPGNISVTIVSGVCTLNLSLPVVVYQNPNVNITNGTICAVPATLTATPLGLVSYVWNGPNAGTGNPFLANSPGTYIVTCTDANNCVGSASITIATPNPPTVTATASLPIICLGSSSVLTGSGAATYLWQPGALTGSPTVSPAVTTIYTVTGTSGNGCTATSTVTITVLPANAPACCLPPAQLAVALIIPNNANTSGLNPTDFVNNSVPIVIDQVLNVDNNFSIINCPNVVLGPNAEIILQNNLTLTINTSNLSAVCGTQWKGIIADHTSEAVVISNSTIRDMNWGVELNNGAVINCQNSTFTDNNLGLRILNSPTGYNLANGNCVIRNNIFTSSGSPLLSPMQAQSQSEIGIYIYKCKEAEVGMLNYSDINEKNIFEHLYNGIYIVPSSLSTTNELKFYNNDFINIHDENIPANAFAMGTIVTQAYTTHRGAGIYTLGFDPIPLQTSITDLHNIRVLHVPDGAKFDHCDKAISLQYFGASVKDVDIEDCPLGIMATNADKQKFDIGNTPQVTQVCSSCSTDIHDVMIGIQILGNTGKSYIQENNIFLRGDHYLMGPLSLIYYWAKGIDIKSVVSSSNSTFEIIDNFVNIPGYGGIGIVLQNTGSTLKVEANEIHFTNILATPTNACAECAADVKGIFISNAVGSLIRENFIQGFSLAGGILNVPVFNARPAEGIYVHKSKQLQINCNDIRNCSEGITVIGDCHTNNDQFITRNRFHNHNFPMLFRHLGGEGSFGNIGNSGYDCANNFTYQPPQGMPGQVFNVNGWKVTRMSLVASILFDEIRTSNSLLVPAESGGNNVNTFYFPINNPGAQTPPSCNINNPFAPQGEEMDSIDIVEATAIALDSVIYPEFPAGSEWMDEQSLYQRLYEDSTLRNSNPIFSSFYTSQQAQATDEILDINRKIAMLNDSTMNDTLLFIQKLAEIGSINNGITPSNIFETNEKNVIGYYLKWLTGGIDSLTENEKTGVEVLALSCPFIEGSAVYKARSLNANLNPGIEYDDLTICNNAGVYKNGSTLFEEENKYLTNLINKSPKTSIPIVGSYKFVLHPNPTQNQLNISYNIEQDGLCIIYDILGNEKQSIVLSRNANHVSTLLNGLASGIYTCKFTVDNGYLETQKLIVE